MLKRVRFNHGARSRALWSFAHGLLRSERLRLESEEATVDVSDVPRSAKRALVPLGPLKHRTRKETMSYLRELSVAARDCQESPRQSRLRPRGRRPIAAPLFVAFGLLLVFCAWGGVRHGGFLNAIAALDGYALVAEQRTLPFGSMSVGDTAERAAVVRNITSQPVTIIGATPDCNCLEPVGLPLRLEPYSTASLTVRLRATGCAANQEIHQRLTLLLDVDSRPVVVGVSATVCGVP